MIRAYSDSNPTIYEYPTASASINSNELEKSLQDRIIGVVEKWFSAPDICLTSERSLLYQETENIINELMKVIDLAERKKLAKTVFLRFNEHSKKHDCEALAKWISENSSHEPGPGMGYVGAIKVLQDVFAAAAAAEKYTSDSDFVDFIFEAEETKYLHEEPTHLHYVIDRSLSRIEELKIKTLFHGYDFERIILSKLNLPNLISLQQADTKCCSLTDELIKLKKMEFKELVDLKRTGKCNKALVLNELVERMNNDEISMGSVKSPFGNVDELINFFGKECEKILSLSFLYLNTEDLNKLAERFTNLEELSFSIKKTTPLSHSFNSLQSIYVDKIEDVDTLKNILNSCPNVKHFESQYLGVNVLDFLKEYPSVKSVDLYTCDLISKIENSLNINYLAIGNLASDYFDLPNLSLPELTVISLSELSLEGIDFNFLKKSPKLEKIIICDCSGTPNFLNFCPSLQTLHLADTSFGNFPVLEKSIQPKRMHLSSCHDSIRGNLSKLLDFPSIETLIIEKSKIEDFGVLKDHTSLKTVYISECTNMETAKVLKEYGINVVYKLLPEDMLSE